MLLGSEIKATVGIEDNPLNPSDISASKANEPIPKNIYKFVECITKSDRQFNAVTDFGETCKEASEREKKVNLSLCQDIAFINSNGEEKMPKRVGLGFTVYNIWRANFRMLNRYGHSISYEKNLEIDSDWGERIQSMGDNPYTPFPTNIVPGIFTQAADNVDFNLDNLDGKDSVHITSLVLCQHYRAWEFFPNIPIRKKGKKRRSVDFVVADFSITEQAQVQELNQSFRAT